MTNILQTFIKDLDQDGKVMQLLREIEQVIQFPIAPYLKASMVVHYLTDYRVRRPITKDSIDAIPFSDDLLLKKKINKLHDTDIYLLCHEIAQMKRSGVEKIAGKTLYVFLDQYLKDDRGKTRRSTTQLPGYLIP